VCSLSMTVSRVDGRAVTRRRVPPEEVPSPLPKPYEFRVAISSHFVEYRSTGKQPCAHRGNKSLEALHR
jgi:hypothetical protein